MDPHLSGYLARERIVLVPAFKDDLGGPAVDDPESLAVCPITMADHELGAAAIRLLQCQRQRDFQLDFRSDAYRQRQARRRKLLCDAFGVKAAKDWLSDAAYVSVVATGPNITINPWRRYGSRDAWSGHAADPVETVPLSDPARTGAALRRLLALKLPPAR